MCTATWWRSADDRERGDYAVFFNRDELKERLPAEPPAIRELNDVRYLAPADGNYGGTWLLANAFGVTVGLLNHYDFSLSRHIENPLSRGHLVVSLADAPSADAVRDRLAGSDLSVYRAFIVFAIDPSPHASVQVWTGKGLDSIRNDPPLLTTSSFDSARVIIGRTRRFLDLGPRPSKEKHLAFHGSHDPEDGAGSVRMRRGNAQTVSFSQIDVRRIDGNVEYRYRPEPADSLERLPETSISLPLETPVS